MEEEKTFYQELREKGYTRRQFLKFCGLVGVMLGLEQSGVAQVINALETKPRKPVIWLHFQECTCCSESFLRASHPLVGQILLELISLDYSDTFMAASGTQAEEVRLRSMKDNWGKYIPVSYTHLDVYKRQMQKNASFRQNMIQKFARYP